MSALFYPEFGTQVAVFDNLIRGEFHFLPASQVNTVEGFVAAGYFPDVDSMLLYDGDGKLTEAAACLRGVQPAFGKAEAEEIVNNLLNYLLYGSNVLLRGEYARSLEVLFFAQRLYLQGIRLLENAAEHFINPNKNLEGEISEEAYRAYAGCTCGLDPAAISVAYANMLGEGKTLAAKLAERYGFDGHEALFGRVEAYFHAGGPEA